MTTVCELTHAELIRCLHYNPRTGLFTRLVASGGKPAGSVAGCIKNGNRVVISIFGRLYYAHRLAWFYQNQCWPKELIDHRDGDSTNNRWDNIREATSSQNNMNKCTSYGSSVGVLGVAWEDRTKKFRPYVTVDKKRIWLGRFEQLKDAIEARLEGVRKHYGGFSYEDRPI